LNNRTKAEAFAFVLAVRPNMTNAIYQYFLAQLANDTAPAKSTGLLFHLSQNIYRQAQQLGFESSLAKKGPVSKDTANSIVQYIPVQIIFMNFLTAT